MASLRFTENDYAWITRELKRVADKHASGRIVSVLEGGYALSAYRLSLLALIGDPESAEMRGRVADLARLPLGVAISHDYETVAREEVAQISRGVLTPSPENTA